MAALIPCLRAALRRLWSDSTRPLAIVKPATVIGWRREGFRILWRRESRSQPLGRPRIAQEHITFIRRISSDHPEWGEDRITEELAAKFGVVHVFVIMEIGSRRIVHDNDAIFGQLGRSRSGEETVRRRRYRCHLDRWLDGVMGIEGLTIPFGAPNASTQVERFMRTLREEALNHFVFLTPDHICRVVNEYTRFYNGARPSQAIRGIPDPYPQLRQPPLQAGKLVGLPVLGGVQHDYRLVA